MGHITGGYIQGKINQRGLVFIETGTFKGGQIQKLLLEGSFDYFSKLYTVELSQEICQVASNRFLLHERYDNNTNMFDKDTDEKDETFIDRKEFFGGKLTLLCGDSGTVLKELMPQINEQCVFWLDAHPGKRHYVGEKVPLLEELDAIKNHHIKNHHIFIDDADKFGIKEQYCNWTEIQYDDVIRRIKDINPEYNTGTDSPFGQPLLYATTKKQLKYNPNAGFIIR